MRDTTRPTLRALTALAAVLATAACGPDRQPAAPTALPTAPVVSPVTHATYGVSGVVVVEAVGESLVPVEGAYVEACGYDSAVSAADGTFRLTQLPVGFPSVYVQKRGYRAQSYPLLGVMPHQIVLIRE